MSIPPFRTSSDQAARSLARQRLNGLELPLATMICGTLASLVSTGALALLARAEGRSALQPINAVSHWLHGPEAGEVTEADLAHTGVGFATQHASAMFWAAPYAWWLWRREHRSAAEVVGGAAAVAGVAAAVDYGLVPRRLTPGWEHAVPARSVAGGFVALALGLAAGGMITEALRR